MTVQPIRPPVSGDGHVRIDLPDRDEPEIVLDLSRLLSRVLHRTPTGVDRVEMAYADMLMRLVPHRLAFGAVHPSGFYGRIPTAAARTFLARTEEAWSGRRRVRANGPAALPELARSLWTMRPRPLPAGKPTRVFLQSSPHHLTNEALVRRILRRENARFVCLLHDLIPIEYPEYARPGGDILHLRRIRAVARIADVVITNSEATRRSFLPYLHEAGRTVAVHVAHLGLQDTRPATLDAPGGRPYFLCLGTIEPRKNHLLLLNLWRQFAQNARGSPIPKLVIVGRRGWENEQVVDMLERCPALRGNVEEHAGLPDDQVQSLLANATALLMPSFAEGYGIPVTEALVLGVPVICSDLAALREAGGAAPDYIDASDGIGWRDAILAYSAAGSARRQAQLARISEWTVPTWARHIGIVLDAIGEMRR